ncbi:kinase-like domain-containing protein [Glomus cerebriforme]|uniref:Kinase-like domain-containing protein n=1 Tax=Glomus cerebriforme TaxID=658196 RepID=A0A397T957_9GLOM|nr:kinase-like domain-containing protein [Glomus cerebriforme]
MTNIKEYFSDINIHNHDQIANYMNNIDENSNPLDVYSFIDKLNYLPSNINWFKWIPYSQITNLKQIAKGGFGIIYKANWLGKDVAVKRFLNSQVMGRYFLNEAKALFQCYNLVYIVKVHGCTQDPETKDFMLIMEYANGGNLHNYLQKNFVDITWKKKLYILWKISEGLNAIHKKNFMHRDFHSGNILLSSYQAWLVCDLGLSQPANNTSLNEIYGVIPYIAPEVFKDTAFTKESDIYSIGMIMWELTTGCKPFANVEHDIILIIRIIDGKRPEITSDTPECFANLIKRCWSSNTSERPSIAEITEIFCDWYIRNKCIEQFQQAEKKRLELIQLKKLGPEFSEKPHSGAIYTSRKLSSMMSNLSSMTSIDTQGMYYALKRK